MSFQNDADDYAGLRATPQDDRSRDAAGDAVGRDWRKLQPAPYDIITNVQTGERSIRCRTCWRISANPNHVEQRYCGYCHRFHEE